MFISGVKGKWEGTTGKKYFKFHIVFKKNLLTAVNNLPRCGLITHLTYLYVQMNEVEELKDYRRPFTWILTKHHYLYCLPSSQLTQRFVNVVQTGSLRSMRVAGNFLRCRTSVNVQI